MREETQELYTAIEKKFNQVPEEQILDLTGETDEEKNTLKEAFDKKKLGYIQSGGCCMGSAYD